MSVTENVEEKVSALDAIFEERDSQVPEIPAEEAVSENHEEKPSEKKSTATPKEEKDPQAREGKKDSSEKLEPKNSDKKVDKEEKDEDGEDEVSEILKLKKALSDSQKWGHTSNRRLKSAVKMVESLKDQGALTDDEFSKLSEFLNADVPDEMQVSSESDDPLLRMINSAQKRIEDLHSIYEEDPLFMKKAQAFDFFVNNCSEHEREEILEELKEFEGSDLKLAKKMYKIGEKYYEENYKELDEAGGLKELVSLKNTEIERMRRKLDKLERKLAEYDDYDKPNYKIDELGDRGGLVEKQSMSILDQAIEERDRRNTA